MSETNVERFTAMSRAFNRFAEAPEALDPDALRTFIVGMDPEVRFEPQQAALQGGYAGRDGVMQWLADLAQHYSRGALHLDEIRDLGHRVLALGSLRIVGRGSGIETDAPVAIVASFRDGLIIHFKDYGGDQGEALEAAGQRE